MGKLIEEIKKLSIEERYFLIDDIWNTIEEEQLDEISVEVKEMIHARLEAHDIAPHLASEESVVFNRIRSGRKQ